jgi:hypothetical protein
MQAHGLPTFGDEHPAQLRFQLVADGQIIGAAFAGESGSGCANNRQDPFSLFGWQIREVTEGAGRFVVIVAQDLRNDIHPRNTLP